MKAQGKYVQLLETELESYKNLLGQARKDVEFYRAKVERLELSLREAGVAVAAPAAALEQRPEEVVSTLKKLPSGRLPFNEIKRRWQAMSEADQEKALKDGWNLDAELAKEASDAGS